MAGDLYAYAGNSPTNMVDPVGTNPIAALAVIGGVADLGAYALTHWDTFDRQEAARWTLLGALAGGTLGIGIALASVTGVGSQAPRFWTRGVQFQGNKVYQRADLIDPARADKLGRTSLQLMQASKSPIGPDGGPVILHHMLQT